VPATATEQPRTGGTWKSMTGVPTGVQDPGFATTGPAAGPEFSDRLLEMNNATRKLSPSVVEKWEQPDKLTLILKLRAGVKFFNVPPANGRELEARDVVYDLRSATGSLYPDAKVPFPRKNLFDGAKDPVAVDKSTVRFDFTTPRSDIFYSFADDRIALVPEGVREYFGSFDSLYTNRIERLVGTGPFLPEKIDDLGESWTRNPDYWNKPYPYLDKVQIAYINDNQQWITGIITGQNEYAERVELPLIDIAKRGLSSVQVVTHAAPSFLRIAYNTRIAPYNDFRVRKALFLLFDKPNFSSVIFGKDFWKYPGPMPYLYPEALSQETLAPMPGFRSPTDADIKDARDLLAAAGLGSGFTGTIATATDIGGQSAFKQQGEHLKEQVEKYIPGSNVTIDGKIYTAILTQMSRPDGWQMGTTGALPEMSPVSHISVFFGSNGSRNYGGLSNPKMDKLVQDALQEFDETKRTQILRDAQNEATATLPVLWTHAGLHNTILRPEVRGVDLGGTFSITHSLRFAWLKA
jgi:peptide/nickel transport system substrate-binding protein